MQARDRLLKRSAATATSLYHPMKKGISPPPLKRRRFQSARSDPSIHQSASTSYDLRIFAWNINGIAPFLPRPQRDITSFFNTSPRKRPRTATHSVSSSDESQQGVTSVNRLPHISLRELLRRHAWPHILMLQEVKIAPDDRETQNLVRKSVAAPPVNKASLKQNDASKGLDSPTTAEPHYEAHFTLPTDPHNARGFGRKVHGVCTIVRADLLYSNNMSVRTVDWDREGRFSIVETVDEANGLASSSSWPKLSIWNVYAVNGTDYPYRSPKTGEVVGTRHDRKLEVHRLMATEVKALEEKGYAVILAGDMNVAREPIDGFPRLRTVPVQHVINRKDFIERFFVDKNDRGDDTISGGDLRSDDDVKGLGMLDTFRVIHGRKKGYTWYSRSTDWGESCDRVDYAICSKSLRGSLKDAGMLETEQDRGPSDHVPVFAAFDFH